MSDDLEWIPAQTYAMGSDRHYPEEGPVHQVSVDGFWIEAHQVTNAQFEAFVDATGYSTVAERPLDPADFPGAPAENLQPGSMVFTKTAGPVNSRHLNLWWTWTPGASWRRPRAAGHPPKDVKIIRLSMSPMRTPRRTPAGRPEPAE
jgi:formylglycine-generating enzyme required for sulfatase activity